MESNIPFNDLYKKWRNKARKFDRSSILASALNALNTPHSEPIEALRSAPWITLLIVKWVCQDKMMKAKNKPTITQEEFDQLRQDLWEFPAQLIKTSTSDSLRLFMRRLLRPQIGFQNTLLRSFIREAALIENSQVLSTLFEEKTGLTVQNYSDLAFATATATISGKSLFTIDWYTPLVGRYPAGTLQSFLKCVSLTPTELIKYCQSLTNSDRKVASEYFEFPIMTRYPFVSNGNHIQCWHPSIVYRGMEHFVHNVLSEEGSRYIEPYSKIFETHCVEQIADTQEVPFYGEDDLRNLMPPNAEVPDGLLSFKECNVFIEVKSGLFGESLMTVGSSEILVHKTRALRKAMTQAWSVSKGLRENSDSPDRVRHALKDYLIIITNIDIGAGRGTALAEMYPHETMDALLNEASEKLPLERIYIMSIDDFERLTIHTSSSVDIDIEMILEKCVEADSSADSTVGFFSQHLHREGVPMAYSDLVEEAFEECSRRLGV